jgi:glycosyltransferase involved in cell wall biosynthesis
MALRQMIGERRFDLVHGHSSKAGFLARLAARSVSRKIVTVYSPHAIAISLNPKYRHLERFAGMFTDAMLGVSRSEREELERYDLVPAEKLCHVTAAVDVDAYRGPFAPVLRERYGVPKNAILVGTAGRMSRQKDPLTFIEIARIVAATEPRAYFVWIGDGELRDQVVARAEQAGIAGRLILPGYSPDIRPWLASLDIFLLTSLYESFGYVTCEAMALGKPVVATRVAGSVELVANGENGFLGSKADPESMAPWVTLLARDSVLRTAMGQNSRQRVEKLYNLKRMTNDLENLYRHLLRRKGRRS